MNAKLCKRIRKAILPSRDVTGIGKGTFMRLLTQYSYERNERTVTLQEGCPRAKYQEVKRYVKRHKNKTRPDIG